MVGWSLADIFDGLGFTCTAFATRPCRWHTPLTIIEGQGSEVRMIHRLYEGDESRTARMLQRIATLVFFFGSISAGRSVEIPGSQKAGISCRSVASCLAIFENPRVTPLDVFPAKLFLDDHADLPTVERIARMLHANNPRLLDRASWFLSTRTERWPTEVDDWIADVRSQPTDAYNLARIPGEATYRALLELAQEDIADEEPVGEALRDFEKGRHVRQVGMAIIRCNVPCAYRQREALLRGLYSDLSAEADADAVRKQLLAMAADASLPDESRRLASIAYDAPVGGIDHPDYAKLRRVFATASPGLRRQLSLTYPRQLGGGRELVPGLVASLSSDPRQALRYLQRLGPAAVAAGPAVESLLKGGSPLIRFDASNALFSIDRSLWRRKIPSLVHDADPMVTMRTLVRSLSDSSGSFKEAKEAARSYWFPGVSRAASDLPTSLAADDQAPPDGAPLEHVDMNHGYMEPLWKQCPALADIPTSVLGLPSLIRSDIDFHQALVESDIPDAYLGAAFRTEHGWILGAQDGESSAKLVYAPTGAPSHQLFQSFLSPSAIFPWRGDMYAIAGEPFAENGVWPELVRLQGSEGHYRSGVVTHFPAAVLDVYGNSGRLIFLLDQSGLVDLTDAEHPRWLGCEAAAK